VIVTKRGNCCAKQGINKNEPLEDQPHHAKTIVQIVTPIHQFPHPFA